jgi:hypothetical protein
VYGEEWCVPIDEKYLKSEKCVWEFGVTEVLTGIGTFAEMLEIKEKLADFCVG